MRKDKIALKKLEGLAKGKDSDSVSGTVLTKPSSHTGTTKVEVKDEIKRPVLAKVKA